MGWFFPKLPQIFGTLWAFLFRHLRPPRLNIEDLEMGFFTGIRKPHSHFSEKLWLYVCSIPLFSSRLFHYFSYLSVSDHLTILSRRIHVLFLDTMNVH